MSIERMSSPGEGRRSRRRLGPFAGTLAALEALTAAGARVALHVETLDRAAMLAREGDHEPMPVAGLGVVPLLVEAAVQFGAGELDPLEFVGRDEPSGLPGLWRHLHVDRLPLGDLAALASADADAANALLARVGLERVTRRFPALGMPRSALLDRFRAYRGPDDAPHVAIGTAREFAGLFRALATGRAGHPGASAQVSEWLSLHRDLGLVGAATGVDPLSSDDPHRLLLLNRTGRAQGVRAEAGALTGPSGGAAYALIVEFDDVGVLHRDRAHEAFRVLGRELMEHTA